MPQSDSGEGMAPLETAVRRSLVVLVILFSVVLLTYLGSGIHFVKPGESALVLRFGRVQPHAQGPGLLLAFPEPIDRVVRLETGGPRELRLESWQARDLSPSTENETAFGPLRHQLDPTKDGYTLTGDANIVQSSVSLRYLIVDPVRFFVRAENPEALLAALYYRAAARTLARAAIDDIIPSGLTGYRDDTLAELGGLLEQLDLGIALSGLEIRELLPPKPVLPAFQDVNSARVEGQTYMEQAKSYRARNQQLAQAEAHGVRTRAVAEAAATVMRAQGRADAFLSMLAASREAPLEFRARMLTEAREDTLPKFRYSTLLPPEGARILLLSPQSGEAR